METSILTTKLNIPPLRPQLVSRPGLIERLQEGLNCNLILVSAPAGFGKTTLVSEWARQTSRQSTAWFSIDKEDNDPTRFWDYFINALQTIQPTCGEKILPLLHTPQPLPVEPMMTELINNLSKTSSESVIVLDDYHLIENQQIHEGITFLIDHIPPHMHLVIASRADPPLPLARFRVRGMMLEIGADELRFTLEDAAGLLKELKAPELSTEDIVALNERTEGWVAGLKIAAMSIKDCKDISGFITSFTGSQRYVMDYLLEEVLQKQTVELREFLLKTSVLERLSSPICDALTERKDSRDILVTLERGHLFLVSLDESRKWFRYEHLFADLLRHQCELSYGNEQVTTLHRTASKWYEEIDLPDDAIHHALTGQDWENAARLIVEFGVKKERSGEHMTLYKWMQRLPEGVISSNFKLCKLFYNGLLWSNEFDTAESILKNLEKLAQGDDVKKGIVAALRAGSAWRRFDFPLTEKLAKKALSLLPPDDLEDHSIMKNLLAWINNMRGDFKEAELLFNESYEGLLQVGSYFNATSALGGVMSNIARKGELRRAFEMAQQALERFGPSPASAILHWTIGVILYEWNELDSAIQRIQQASEMGRLIGSMQGRVLLHNILAEYKLTLGDITGFQEASAKADVEARDIGESPTTQAHNIAFHIRFAIKQDDMEAASEWGNKLTKYAGDLQVQYQLIPMRLLIAQGKRSEAMEKLQVIYSSEAQSRGQHTMIICRIYQAIVAETEEEAIEFLSDALTLAEPEGYIRTFVDEGKLLKTLLEKALSRGITPEYTRKLISIIEAEERQKLKRKKAEGVPSKYDSILSEREIEVLKLIAEGLSNQQIADRLIITLGTTKNHVHNIIEKLEAKGRTQAVTQARELDLI